MSGGQLRRPAAQELSIPDLPASAPCTLQGTYNVVVTRVGGTGVVTIGALLAMAAYLDGKAAGVMEMAGLAQKGGAVHIHCRIGETPEDISAIRVALGECDALIGGDLVVSAQGSTLGLMAPTGGAVVNRHEIITGEFTRDTAFAIPGADLHLALTARLQERVRLLNATRLAETALGDTVYANMILLGAAYQQGLLPLTQEALLEAIALNGAKVAQNQQAFALGRWAMVDADLDRKFERIEAPVQDPEAARVAGLRAYGSGRSARYEAMRRKLQGMEPDLRETALQSYHKLLSYKDEYEVARLLQATKTQVSERYEGDYEISYHLAPPLLAKKGPDGRPQKRSFGAWFDFVSQGLARLRFLRETPLDPFGYSAERRMERQLIKDFESLVARMLREYEPARLEMWRELLSLPLNIRGFGPVKLANAQAMQKRGVELLTQLTLSHDTERSAA